MRIEQPRSRHKSDISGDCGTKPSVREAKDKKRAVLTRPLVSNASQSPVPVGRRPIERHFHSPTANVSKLHATYASFWSGSVSNEFAFEDVGAKGAKAIIHHGGYHISSLDAHAVFTGPNRRSMCTHQRLSRGCS
jgi:hypothetical protein